MRIALLGDVHANLPALDAVLADVRQVGVDARWNVGDFIGYGPFPDAVVRTLRAADAVSILGNYDAKVLKYRGEPARVPAKTAPEKALAFTWAYAHLSEEQRGYLASLPTTLRLTVEGRSVLLVHGSPAAISEHLTPATTDARLRELAALADAELVVCGHSHQPFARRVDGVWFINPGSVGRPDDGDPRASYALLEVTPETVRVQHRRLAYDISRLLAALEEYGLPASFSEMFRRGRDLATVEQELAEEAPWLQAAPPAHRPALEAVLATLAHYQADRRHAYQVTRLALLLFDRTHPLHELGDEERFLLQCGALLHDIGWIDGVKGHHKRAMALILQSALPVSAREQLIIALLARYHRRALPRAEHAGFSTLTPDEQRRVVTLAALLRVADGLDAGHAGVVDEMTCDIGVDQVHLQCQAHGDAAAEVQAALKKGTLFEQRFERTLRITWHYRSAG